MQPAWKRALRIAWLTLKYTLIALFVAVSLYGAVFAIACTYGAWWAYQQYNTFLDQVRVLKDANPAQSAYMKTYQLEHPGLKIKQKFVPMDSISPNLPKAVLAAEDAGFYFHPGFDVRAIAEALDANRQRGKNAFGASTISQQLAKNLFLSSERSWERKGKELGFTLLMEHYLGKDRILELYLNYAQWGKDIFGAEMACETYFKKSCKAISMDQAISMAAMLASPEKHTPFSQGGFMGRRRAVIYQNLYGPKDSLSDSTGDSLADTASQATESAPVTGITAGN